MRAAAIAMVAGALGCASARTPGEVDAADPIEGWAEHNRALAVRTGILNEKRYAALRFTGPGTDLEVGLCDGHRWAGGAGKAENGITYNANIPTEEVFTTPHRARVNGHVAATKPLSYQGTLIQNAANYSRFEITSEVEYMDNKIEENILMARTDIDRATAAKIVKFANEVRKYFKDGKINTTISPRELISAVQLGIAYGANWLLGIELAYANRCSRVDRKTVLEYAQRVLS